MRVLVTGGAGYIGSHTARRLARAGHDVWCYDNLSRGHRPAVAAGRLIEGDLCATALLRGVLAEKRIEGVVHFAAFALVGESVADPASYYVNNVAGTLSLLEAMRACDVRRLVFSSSCATYGDPVTLPMREEHPQRPINPYGRSKLMVEQILSDEAAAYELGFAALRYFNAAGASPDGDLGEDHTPESHLIPITLQVALGQREAALILGDDYPTPDGTCVRDYIHVDDLADAHVAALTRIAPGQRLLLNLGTGRGHSVREVIESCRRVTGHAIPARVAPRRPGDPPSLVADASAAARELGWTARYTDLDQIVATAWQWHARHPRGYGDAPSQPDT